MSPQSSASGIRARNRAAIESAIIELGRAELAKSGAAALSVRAIARELGMASSAVYRYVRSRDELLTLLIVTAYNEVADEVDQALSEPTLQSPRERFYATGHAMRGWAIQHPHDWALLYGSPVPEYDAPSHETNPPGTRVVRRLSEILSGVEPNLRTGDQAIVAAGLAAISPELLAETGLAQQARDHGTPDLRPLVQRGLAAWTLLVGAINSELFGYLGKGTLTDPRRHFSALLALAADLVFGEGHG